MHKKYEKIVLIQNLKVHIYMNQILQIVVLMVIGAGKE